MMNIFFSSLKLEFRWSIWRNLKCFFTLFLKHFSFGFDKSGFKSESAGNSASKSAKYVAGKHSAALVFTYKQLQVATHNFHDANVVGRGGFGTVYKGVLPDGRTAAIKQLDQSSKQGDLEFRVEVCSRCVNSHSMCV